MNVACPHCGGHVLDDGNYSSQVVACPFCDKQFQMPAAEVREAAMAAATPAPPVATEVNPNDQYNRAVKPWQVTTIGVLRIASGVLNVSFGLPFFWLVLPLLLIPLGIAEVISGANLLAARPKYPSSSRTLAILEIVAIVTCGVIPLVVGILSLAWFSQGEVESYLASLPGAPRDFARPLVAPHQSAAP